MTNATFRRLALAPAVLLAAVSFAACSHSSNVSTASSTAASSSAAPGAASATVIVPAGTVFRGKLQQEIGTRIDVNGDRFSIVGPHGETVNGHVDNVHKAGLARKPSMTIVFDNVRMADGTIGQPVTVKIENMGIFNAKSHHLRTIGMMIGGAVAGHMATHKVPMKHGALAGAAAGYVLSQEMKTDVDVKKGTTVVLKFTKPVLSTAGQP